VTKSRLLLASLLLVTVFGEPRAAQPQPPRTYRVGVVLQGGSYSEAVDGLRDGLRELGLAEGKQVIILVHDAKGDLKSIEAAARRFEDDKVDLIYAVATSVALATKRVTKHVPIVFYAGTDPVTVGLVETYGKPGGRLTGIHGQLTDLTGKRLQVMKEMLPKLRRVVTFYNPENPAAQQSLKLARDAARGMKVELMERHVATVEELRTGLRDLRPGEADGLFYVSDAMVGSQEDLLIATALAKKLPMLLTNKGSALKGALASYGESYFTLGRLSAKHVRRILLGADPANLPVEKLDRPQLVINLKTAKALGVTFPRSILARADEIIQ